MLDDGAYTPGGVSSVLTGSASGKPKKHSKHKAENKAVLDLFSKKVPRYDYTKSSASEPAENGSTAAKSGKKRKHKHGKEQVDIPAEDAGQEERAQRKKKHKHSRDDSSDQKAENTADHSAKEKPRKNLKHQDKDASLTTASSPQKKNKKDRKNSEGNENDGTNQSAKKKSKQEKSQTPDKLKLKAETDSKHVYFGNDDEDDDLESDDDMPKLKKPKRKKSAPGPERDSRTIFVGNLPVVCTKKKLVKVFRKFGKIESIRFRSAAVADLKLPKKAVVIKQAFHSERHNINAYVVFVEREAAVKALELNGTILHGQNIRVDSSVRETKHDHNKCVFVGNMPFNVEEDALRKHFDECGDISNVRIVRDNKTGLGKGIGYVQFADSAAVGLALKMHRDLFEGRELRVQRSNANPQSNKDKKSRQKKHGSPKKQEGKKKKKKEKKPKGSQDMDAKSSDDIDAFEGTKAQTAEKLKQKLKSKKLKVKHKDRRKQNLKEIFGAAKDTRKKQPPKEKKLDKKGETHKSKEKGPKHGQKFSGKGKIFARNRLAKKMKR